jgi:putative endonuclease
MGLGDRRRARAAFLPALDGGMMGSRVERSYYVYIVASRTRVLYVGVTNDLARRVWEHKEKLTPGFTSKYNVNRLVYYEETSDVKAAIAREKQIKGWLRAKKVALIEGMNPGWADLSDGWY